MRPEGWPERLQASIDAARCMPFAYGQHDCCLFMAVCIDAMLGTAYAAQWRGTYDDEASAKEILSRTGGIEAMLSAVFKEVNTPFAWRGDAVQLDLPENPFGINLGRTAVAAGPDGLVFPPRRRILKAWRIE